MIRHPLLYLLSYSAPHCLCSRSRSETVTINRAESIVVTSKNRRGLPVTIVLEPLRIVPTNLAETMVQALLAEMSLAILQKVALGEMSEMTEMGETIAGVDRSADEDAEAVRGKILGMFDEISNAPPYRLEILLIKALFLPQTMSSRIVTDSFAMKVIPMNRT